MRIGIITGASSGMGRLFALYAKHFYPDLDELWLIGRNMKRLAKVSFKLNISSCIFPVDITKNDGLNVLINELNEKKPEVELLINSAGMGIIGSFETINNDDIEDIISVNCTGLSKVTRTVLDYMIDGGTIINLASAAAFVPQPEFIVYAASKSYVLSFSLALNEELRERNISVTAVCPGSVDTPFFNVAQKYSEIKSYKKLFMANDKAVVIKAFKDAKKRKRYSVYGVPMKALQVICKLLPSSFIMKFV